MLCISKRKAPAIRAEIAASRKPVAALAGIALLESPAQARQRGLDFERIQDLARLSAVVRVYWQRHERLPENLAALPADPKLNVRMRDPDE